MGLCQLVRISSLLIRAADFSLGVYHFLASTSYVGYVPFQIVASLTEFKTHSRCSCNGTESQNGDC